MNDLVTRLYESDEASKLTNEAAREIERLRETLMFLDNVIEKNLTENHLEGHRLVLEDGVYTGPPVDFLHTILREFQRLSRNTLNEK